MGDRSADMLCRRERAGLIGSGRNILLPSSRTYSDATVSQLRTSSMHGLLFQSARLDRGAPHAVERERLR